MSAPTISTPAIVGQEHWTQKGSIRLFLWAKHREPRGEAGTILFVHGSSMASTPTFDLQVPGRASAMDYFADLGYDTWCVDMEGYGRSDKHRDINADIATGADDLAVADPIARTRSAALAADPLPARPVRRDHRPRRPAGVLRAPAQP